MELRTRSKALIFLVVVAVLAWPGYQAVTTVTHTEMSVVAPTAQPPWSSAEGADADRPTPTMLPSPDPSTPGLTQTPTPAQASMPTLTLDPASTTVPTLSPPPPMRPSTLASIPTSTRTSTSTHVPTQVLPPKTAHTPSSTPVPTAALSPTPHLRYADEKRYMLQLINNERRVAGVPEVVLGVNNAAQLHAEDSLEGCHSSHWGSDGLKPYMRYSLTGGYQSNGENGSGSDYCIRARDRYVALSGIKIEIRDAMAGWMSSPGHRRNILERKHKKVNIGLAWDRYNLIAVQHFEGDYVEYETLPEFDEGKLRLEGQVKNGARFGVGDTIPVQIFYDPPPYPLTPGQLSGTYCYGSGLPVAYIREPLTGDWYYPEDSLRTTYSPCSSPYEVSQDVPPPQSPSQANAHWRAAYIANQSRNEIPVVMQAVTASSWRTGTSSFRITASLGKVLKKHGPGVYTVVLWGVVGVETEIISEYSIFHDIPRPGGYD